MQKSVLSTVTLMVLLALVAGAQELRVDLTPEMVINESETGDPTGLVDEQRLIVGPPLGKPSSTWTISSAHNKQYPFSAHIDLGEEKNLSTLWIFDTHGNGDVVISYGKPDAWVEHATYGCGTYMNWASVQLDVTTRYLRLTKMSPGAGFTEVAVYEYTPEAHQAMLAEKAAAAKAKAEREAALKLAREEALKRPLIEMEPYGTLSLIEEIDCSKDPSNRIFSQYPEDHSKVQTILGKPCRVLSKVDKEACFFSYRIGRQKLLRPGGVYVVAVDYPEDAPRSMVVINTGNETSRGFHTGSSVGDAFRAKYVSSLCESIATPLSGKWETWSLLFRLHDRYPEKGLVRGDKQRGLTPEDGFDVTIAQFSSENIPISQGAAVSSIRLFEIIDPEKLAQPLNLPPEGLPRRHLFWREEMADGLLAPKGKTVEERGVNDRLDWYRYKAELMRFLGMHTYSKDLLEFGACQHWDSTPYGGNNWVYFAGETKDLWANVVELMGQYGFDVLPYYEYSGSKGYKGLGSERRCKPLTRDDAYTHITWVESSNADITDPDTYEDFKKMLDLTVVRLQDKANFVGAWMRTRSQIPVSFGPGALERFARETNAAKAVTRDDIKNDQALYKQYLDWWSAKRRDFFVAMRDYLRQNGIKDAAFLYTGCPSEPGVGFPSWTPRMVTDAPEQWTQIVAQEIYKPGEDRQWEILTPQQVVDRDLYLQGQTSAGKSWGGWEVHHARPADDPLNYQGLEGVMLTHAFNRLYTVSSPRTFDAYRTAGGLAMVRHYALNENMMFDKDDKTILGYFVADIEMAGPYCMLAEANAMANGDPTMIGYLSGCNYGRGFPKYVRQFNANYLALPALPSRVLKGASSDPEVVVRVIETAEHGTYLAVVNTGLQPKGKVSITLPGKGQVHDAVLNQPVTASGGKLDLSLYPCELKSFHMK